MHTAYQKKERVVYTEYQKKAFLFGMQKDRFRNV